MIVKTRIRVLMAMLLAAVLAFSCMRQDIIIPEEPQLYVRVSIPDAVLTRAETGTHTATEAERTVSSLQIWVFRAGATTNAGLIGYKTLDTDALAATGLKNGSAARFAIAIDKALLEEVPRTNVDVYAVVNGASAGLTIDKFPSAAGDWNNVSPSDLASFVLDTGLFGVASLVTTVPSGGLPMAGVLKNEPMTGDFPVLSISTVNVTRAVSKLRFVFCQMTENGTPVNEFHITGISLTGQIGRDEKLFTDQVFSSHTYLTRLFDSEGYVTLDKNWTSSSELPTIANHATPGDYLYSDTMTTQEYEDLIDGGVSGGHLTQWGLTYLRETDKKLTGTISYTVGTGTAMRSKTATFSMDAEGDFTRNHSWIIYAYFFGGRLVIVPVVLPWIAGQNRLSYSTMGSTEMKYERPWLRYDRDSLAWTWDDTHVAIAFGYKGGNSGIPTRSPRITFETINQNELRIQLNNAHFRLVQVTHGFDAENNPTEMFSQLPLGEPLIIPGSPNLQTTEVYVVPENDSYMADPYVKLMLTEIHPGGIPPMNLPFNHNLPGDEDHACIRYYNPGANAFDANKDNPKINGNIQAHDYWLEEVQ